MLSVSCVKGFGRVLQIAQSWPSWGIHSIFLGKLRLSFVSIDCQEASGWNFYHCLCWGHPLWNTWPRIQEECYRSAFRSLQSWVLEWGWIPWRGGENGLPQFCAPFWHLFPKQGCFFMKKIFCSFWGSKPVLEAQCHVFIFIIPLAKPSYWTMARQWSWPNYFPGVCSCAYIRSVWAPAEMACWIM